ncbi:MAG TPA: MFS transporter [Planctomycetota bacterium]|nr:MFS transporter [Planctomycetota bacterium]
MTATANDSRSGRSFRWLVAAQFLGAFNDNLFKQLLLLLAARWLFPGRDEQGIAFAVFALPFLLCSGIAGDLSERFSKRTIIVQMKVAEIGIMLLGAVALQLRQWELLLAVLFLMGLQSAVFGPSKYGVIPEIVPHDRLLRANGLIAMTTFLAILLGQAVAGPLLDYLPSALWASGTICTGFAVIGWLCALRMAPLPAARPTLRLPRQPFGNLFQTMAGLRRQRHLFTVVLANSMFWFNGGVLQQAVNGLGGDRWLAIGADENKLLSLLLVTLAASIMLGCMLAPRLARRIAAARLVLGGAALMVAAQALLMLVGPVLPREAGGYLLAHAALALAGCSGAMFVVPINTYLQDAPEPGTKGQTFAVNNFCNFAGIFVAGGFYELGSRLDLAPAVTATAGGLLLLASMAVDRGWLRALGRVNADETVEPAVAR